MSSLEGSDSQDLPGQSSQTPAHWTPASSEDPHTEPEPPNRHYGTGVLVPVTNSPPNKRRREEKERVRVSRACDRCKRKKIRCNGRCPCPSCLRSKLSCEFTASYTRGRLPSVIVDQEALDSIAQNDTPAPSSKPLAEECLQTVNATDLNIPTVYASPAIVVPPVPMTETRENSYPNPSPRSSPEPTHGQTDQEGHYVGASSAVSFLIRIQKRLHQVSSASQDTSIFTFGDAPLPEFETSFFVLPAKVDAQRLVERYFEYAAPTHRFLHRPSIENLVEEFYDARGELKTEDGRAKTALLMVTMAQAQAYMPPGSQESDNGARFFFAAEQQLSKERGAIRLASVQARLLQCFYLLTRSRINHCWSLFGSLSHLALAIGLHRGRKHEAAGPIDYVQLESRRRLFWCMYTLDKYLAAALGRPRTFKDEDIDQELPTIVDDNDLHPTHIAPSNARSRCIMMAPVEHYKLSRIVSLVLRDLYPIRPPSLNLRLELSAKYTADLHAWRASLSHFLGDSITIDSHLLIPIYQRQRSVLNLSYYHAMLLIHRPFLLSNFASLTHMRTHSTLAPNAQIDTSKNIAACLEAAIGIVRVIDDIFTSSNLFRSFWFSQFYAFSAVVVLYIYRIRQQIVTPGKCEGYFAAGQACQRQLQSVSETDCMARRYCLVLEELRLEALRQTGNTSQPTNLSDAPPPGSFTPAEAFPPFPGRAATVALQTVAQSSRETPDYSAHFYTHNIPTPDSAVFNSNHLPPSSVMDDLTSWGQFDSLVTAGVGGFDGGFQGDSDFGFGFGL